MTALVVREVSPRDGLQAELSIVSTSSKTELVDRLTDAGFSRINVSSFVSPTAVPQMADAAEVFHAIVRKDGVTYDATVPNIKGAQRAIQAKAGSIVVFVAASEQANRSGVRRSTEEALCDAEEVINLARSTDLAAIGTVATAFGSPYGEEIPLQRIVELVDRLIAAGATGVSLGDTTGEATPIQVREMVDRLRNRYPDMEFGLHLHDTRGMAVANAFAAIEAGVTHLDGSLGGIGGSPFTKNSLGNLATEELLVLCESMNVETGIDFEKVISAYNFLADVLGHELPSRVGRLHRKEP